MCRRWKSKRNFSVNSINTNKVNAITLGENNENEVKFTNAGNSWKLKGVKDEDRGTLKSELKAGFEAGNYNIYLTGGYNTKGKNSHVGINFGVSF